ncbi:hypothetical protein [Streptomyces eurythermus]|uniref:hypothetical protein n=1 Tax=Streptomyces eurythermus TaxID=42237 RepID=UPI0036F66548
MLREQSGRRRRAVVAAIGCAPAAVVLTACGDDGTAPSPTPTPTPTSPDTASFSGLPSSALASQAASAIDSARASAAAEKVLVDFEDSSGKVVETRFAGVEDLGPGEKEQPVAFGRQPADAQLTPRLAKAQRY